MEKRTELEKMIVELKLAQRELVLLGKNTNIVDEKIKNIEKRLASENVMEVR